MAMPRRPLSGLPPFVSEPEIVLTVDAIARRYGVLPHQVLEMSPWDLGLAFQCVQQAARSSAQAVQRMQAAGGILPVPIPVIVIPSPYGGM
jgi:hypothetical protein